MKYDTIADIKSWPVVDGWHSDGEVYKRGTEGTLIVSDWFARKQGWE